MAPQTDKAELGQMHVGRFYAVRAVRIMPCLLVFSREFVERGRAKDNYGHVFERLRFYTRKDFNHIVQQGLCIRDGCFDLIFGNINDVAVIEAIAESVDVIQPTPAIAFPFDGVSETLKHKEPV
jgi:hypothetical protein